MSDRPKLVWRSKRVLPQEQRYRNTLFPRDHRRYVDGGVRWWLVIAGVLVFGGVGTAIWSPLLTITTVTISGNTSLDAATIQTAADSYLNGKTLGIFPRRSFIVASAKGMASSIQKALRGNPAVTAVNAHKIFPFVVAVAITEQIPNVVYNNNGVKYFLDRDGIITSLIPDGTKVQKKFPQLYDQTSRAVAVGASVVRSSALDALFATQNLIKQNTDINIYFFFLPPVACPKTADQAGEGEQTKTNVNAGTTNANKNKNSNTNGTTSNRNSNATTSSANKNASTTNAKKGNAPDEASRTGQAGSGTAGNANVAPTTPACDLNAIILKNPELNIRTSEKWDIMMRSDQSIEDQIARLVRVLNETKPNRKSLHSIDLRFGENVIVR